jgi:NAD-dependent deacetylase
MVFMEKKKKIVVLTGAGVSAESGISTFRDAGGLWEKHRIEDVATYSAWQKNRELVLKFYNQRRRQLAEVKPNAAHYALAKLEKKFDIQIITQNVDDLHERGGSNNILHLHGEMVKARSTVDENLVYNIGYKDINIGDKCERGSQLRPHIVWFGEAVPNIVVAAEIATEADILIVIGTSLNVYPAAGLINYVPKDCPKYLIDPKANEIKLPYGWKVLAKKAGEGVPELVDELLNSVKNL